MALLAPTASAQYVIFGWKISEFQPDVPNGGRATTISVNPLNNDPILVASDSGSLLFQGATMAKVNELGW